MVELTKHDRIRLNRYESLIQRCMPSFVEVGAALLHIRGEKLYRETHRSFEAYCKDRWGFTRQRAHQYIESAVVVNKVSTIVDTFPRNESQARELCRLPDGQRASAWKEAVETAPQGIITASHVRQVVSRRLPQQQPSICVDENEINEGFDVNDFLQPSIDSQKVNQDEALVLVQVKEVISIVVRAETRDIKEYQRMAVADYLEELAEELRA